MQGQVEGEDVGKSSNGARIAPGEAPGGSLMRFQCPLCDDGEVFYHTWFLQRHVTSVHHLRYLGYTLSSNDPPAVTESKIIRLAMDQALLTVY